MDQFQKSLTSVLETLSLHLGDEQYRALLGHYELLVRWNARINLTSLRSPEEIAIRHFGESLFLARALPGSGTLVDIGSGAGFPGAPIATLWPGMRVTLVESRQKKAVFLKELARQSKNIEVLHSSFEASESRFDWGTLRAVRPGRIWGSVRARVGALAMLVTEGQIEAILGAGGVHWREPIRLPWGNSRCLLIGTVPRGT